MLHKLGAIPPRAAPIGSVAPGSRRACRPASGRLSKPTVKNMALIETLVATAQRQLVRGEGVSLSEVDMTEAAFRLGEAMANALSSTAQDISHGKRTEIDSLNGYVVRRGAEAAVETPVNQALYTLVKLLENSAGSEERYRSEQAQA
jgi:hypothetical protein